MVKDIEKQLIGLFNEWKTAQENDSSYDWEKTGIAVASFTPDGVINEDYWTALPSLKKKKVLYLLREANGNFSRPGDKGKKVDDGNFWFKDCIESLKTNNRIFKRIVDMQRVIQKEEYLKDIADQDFLEQVAYMNINKRGGGATVDWKVFNEYAKKYREYIKREICIIKPDVIVCCGTYWTLVDIICELYKPNNNVQWKSGTDKDFCYDNAKIKDDQGNECYVKILNMYHPSARMSDDRYIDRFKSIYRPSSVGEKTREDSLLMSPEDVCAVVKDMNPKSEEYYELCEFLSNIKEIKND